MSEINHTASNVGTAPAPGWARKLGQLWMVRPGLKFLGISLFMWLFFSAYFHLLRHPAGPVTVMPLTPLDEWIAFQPAALWPYVSLWFYVGITPSLTPTLRALAAYGAWAAALCLSGLASFYLWPTAVPAQAHAIDPALAQYPGFALLRGVDAAGNACPSMHVAGAMFSLCWTHRLLLTVQAPVWTRWLNIVWFLLIAWSTVAVRQHVVLDVLGGALLGAAFAALSLRFGPALQGSRYH